MADLTLYGSLNVSRAWWTAWMCRELGIEFHNDPLEPRDPASKAPEYLTVNPNGLMPSIRDGEFVLWESMAINLYLAQKYGSGQMCPDTLEGKALASQWSFWAVTRVEAPLLVVSIANRHLPAGDETEEYYLKHIPMWTEEEVARSREVLSGPFKMLDEKLESSAYLLGPAFSVADLNVASI